MAVRVRNLPHFEPSPGASRRPLPEGEEALTQRFPSTPEAGLLRVVRRYNLRAFYRFANGGIAPCGESGGLACGRMRLQQPALDAAAPTTDPCPDSSGSVHREFDGRQRRLPPQIRPNVSK